MTLTVEHPDTPLVAARPVRRPRVPAPPADVTAGVLTLRDLVRVVLTLTVVGAVIAGLQLVHGTDPADSSSPSVLRTPYGLVAVGQTTVSAAVPAADKGMVGKGHAAHAAPADGPAGVRVNVPVTLHNRSDDPVHYGPEHFALAAGSATAQPEDSPLLTGELRPGAAVSLRLTFALPAAATGARLLVDDGEPVHGLDLRLPAASVPGTSMTPQLQPTEQSAPAPAPPKPHGH